MLVGDKRKKFRRFRMKRVDIFESLERQRKLLEKRREEKRREGIDYFYFSEVEEKIITRGKEEYLESLEVFVEMLDDQTPGLEDDGSKDLKSQSVGLGDRAKEPKKRKRNLSTVAEDECHITTQENFYKRIVLSLTRPEYLLGIGFNQVRPENRVRLYCLLRKLVRQHNWTEVSGVLSMLLKGTCKDKCSTVSRFKYLASMEFLKHRESDDVNLAAISGIYDTWMTRIGINIVYNRNRTGYMKEDVFIVWLESILVRLVQGHIEDERHNFRSLMRQYRFEGHPIFPVIIGLIFYQLWYSSIPENMQWKDPDQISTPTHSDMSTIHSQFDMSATRFSYEVGGSEGHTAVSHNESESSLHYDSETSVMNNKKVQVKADSDFNGEVASMEVDTNLQKNLPPDIKPPGFYVNSDENEASGDNNGGHMHFIPSLFDLKSLNSWLLPLRTKIWDLERMIQDDEYTNAVKNLQEAVYSTPQAIAALLPLIQLLLIGCKYKDALHELEMFCGNSNAALPSRLRAHLMEIFNPKNTEELSACFEDTLKRDPTCSESLTKLISLHQNGNYTPDSLLEMIALHLDAVYAEYSTWREFALCFLKVSQYEEDRLSVCLHGNEAGERQGHSFCYKRIPKLFTHGNSGRAWRIRCRWWLARHFSKKHVTTEIAGGDLQLLTYKAACASHMYGPKSEYVVNAYTCIQKENNRDLLKFLQLHMQNSVGFYLNFQQKTN